MPALRGLRGRLLHGRASRGEHAGAAQGRGRGKHPAGGVPSAMQAGGAPSVTYPHTPIVARFHAHRTPSQ